MATPAHANRPDTVASVTESDLENLIGYNMKRAYVTIQKDFRAALGEGGLAPRTFSALSLVVGFPNLSQSELARMIGIERSGLVAIIDELETRGFVLRNTVPGDRRVQALSPTPAGTKAYRATFRAVQAHEDRLLAELSNSEKETLMTLLRKIRMTDESA